MARGSPKRDRILQLAEAAILSGRNPSPKQIALAMATMNVSVRSVETTLLKLRAQGKLPRRMRADFLKKTDAARQGERDFVEAEATDAANE